MTPLESGPAAPPPHSLGRLTRAGLVLVPAGLAALAWGGPARYFPQVRQSLGPEVAAADHPPADGAKLFAQNCAYCHGPHGEGDGVAALTTKARYFGAEPYKFTTTVGTRIPTDADLIGTLKRGIPGSSMPSFANLSDDQLHALVAHVRVLTRRGLFEQLRKKAQKDYDDGGDEVDLAKVATQAETKARVGDPLPLPAHFPQPTPQSVAAGKAVFQTSCASCHGPGGRGDGPQTADPKFVNDNGTKAVPRNLTAGVFKGGGDPPSLYARLIIGIPGTPMPAASTLKPEEVEHLIHYVRALSSP